MIELNNETVVMAVNNGDHVIYFLLSVFISVI